MESARGAGFTLLELMVVLAIIGVLGAISIHSFSRYINKIRLMEVINEIRDIERAIKVYETLNGSLPETLRAIGMDKLRDRWGNPYRYLRIQDSDDFIEKTKGKDKSKDPTPGKGKQRRDRSLNPVNTDYDLYSMGPDGETQVQFTAAKARDDIVRANNGDYVGIASDY